MHFYKSLQGVKGGEAVRFPKFKRQSEHKDMYHTKMAVLFSKGAFTKNEEK
ncbi:MAG: hypothetical protein LBP19_00200 [Treponema sp.]|jgi:hypothetical protein|nr:hypothetical protein [Treponema sp.]